MSRETRNWLNNNVLVGMTDQRGFVWHYDETEQGAESNHYPSFIPVEDVERRLFNWRPVQVPSYVDFPVLDSDGEQLFDRDGEPVTRKIATGEAAILASDDGTILGNHGMKFSNESFNELLLDNVSQIMGMDLGVSSAGLLKKRSIAWVEVSVPETVHTPEGVSFRPNLLATASFDSSTPTIYKRTKTLTVCDNTREMALSENGEEYRVKRTSNSRLRLLDARNALSVIHEDTDAFASEIAELCAWHVNGKQWNLLLKTVIPVADDATAAAVTRAENTRDKLTDLWANSLMVAPWKGTAFGALQAFNTYRHHYQGTRGDAWEGGHQERNMFNAVKGTNGAADRQIIDALRVVTA